MPIIDLSADEPPIIIERGLSGAITLTQGAHTVTMTDAEVDEFIRAVRPAQTPAKLMKYRMA